MLFNSHLGNQEVNYIFLSLYEFIKIPNMLVIMHAYNIQIQLKYKILNPVSYLLINYVLIWLKFKNEFGYSSIYVLSFYGCHG